MKERLTNNLWLKLLSVCLAFFLWLVVVNISNPVVTKTKEVPIAVENEEVLESSDLTYEIIGKSSVLVSYEVRTLDEYKIKASDFRAYIDLADLYEPTGSVPVEIEVLNNKELLTGNPAVSARPSSIRIETEKIQKKGFDLEINEVGTPEDGYALGTVKADKETVNVKGPVSLVGQISSVGIEIKVEGANSDLSGTASPVYYDANGNKLSLGDKVTIDSPEISYEAQILKVKTLTLDFEVEGDVAAGYRFTGVESDMKEVAVVGLKSTLASQTTIAIPATELDIDGASSDKVVVIDITQYLPPGTTLVGDRKIVTIKLKVEALTTRSITLTTGTDISRTGESGAYTYTFGSQEIDVTVRGLSEDLDSLSAGDLKASVDVTSMGPGTYKVSLKFGLDDSFSVVSYTDLELVVADKATAVVTPENPENSQTDESTEKETTKETAKETTAAE